MQVDDYKFVGVLFVPFGLAQIGFGVAGFDAVAAAGELLPVWLVASGSLTVVAGVSAFRRLWWARYAVGLAAFLLAPGFPFGTVLAAVGFIAIGRNWHGSPGPHAPEMRR